MADKLKRPNLWFETPHLNKSISTSRHNLLPNFDWVLISLEKSTAFTVFERPLKHLTSEGSSAVAIVLIIPLASSITADLIYDLNIMTEMS